MRAILLCAAALIGSISITHAQSPAPSVSTLLYEVQAICGAHQVDALARGAGYQAGYELCAKLVPRVMAIEKRAADEADALELKSNQATLAAAEKALEGAP